MNAAKSPKVRDLTERNRRIPIESDGSSVYDLLLTMWATFDEEEDHSSFELGADWFSQTAESIPDDLREELVTLGGRGTSDWLSLIGLIASSPYPHDIDSVLEWLAGLDPAELRRGLLCHHGHLPSRDTDEIAERAVRGDAAAISELLCRDDREPDRVVIEHYQEMFAVPMAELRDRMVGAVRRFRNEVYHRFEEEFGSATSRAAAARRALVTGADPERIIEDVTNGAAYRVQPGVSRIVLIPSVVLRPWAIIDEHRDTLVVIYAVADEFIDADPDAPPSWLVKMHKALGDERRLRILRRLSEGAVGLDDLTEMLGLTKSTVHHHVGLLRAAGLIRVHIDPGVGKCYDLRETVLPEARRALDAYLRADDPADQLQTAEE